MLCCLIRYLQSPLYWKRFWRQYDFALPEEQTKVKIPKIFFTGSWENGWERKLTAINRYLPYCYDKYKRVVGGLVRTQTVQQLSFFYNKKLRLLCPTGEWMIGLYCNNLTDLSYNPKFKEQQNREWVVDMKGRCLGWDTNCQHVLYVWYRDLFEEIVWFEGRCSFFQHDISHPSPDFLTFQMQTRESSLIRHLGLLFHNWCVIPKITYANLMTVQWKMWCQVD